MYIFTDYDLEYVIYTYAFKFHTKYSLQVRSYKISMGLIFEVVFDG